MPWPIFGDDSGDFCHESPESAIQAIMAKNRQRRFTTPKKSPGLNQIAKPAILGTMVTNVMDLSFMFHVYVC